MYKYGQKCILTWSKMYINMVKKRILIWSKMYINMVKNVY